MSERELLWSDERIQKEAMDDWRIGSYFNSVMLALKRIRDAYEAERATTAAALEAARDEARIYHSNWVGTVEELKAAQARIVELEGEQIDSIEMAGTIVYDALFGGDGGSEADE